MRRTGHTRLSKELLPRLSRPREEGSPHEPPQPARPLITHLPGPNAVPRAAAAGVVPGVLGGVWVGRGHSELGSLVGDAEHSERAPLMRAVARSDNVEGPRVGAGIVAVEGVGELQHVKVVERHTRLAAFTCLCLAAPLVSLFACLPAARPTTMSAALSGPTASSTLKKLALPPRLVRQWAAILDGVVHEHIEARRCERYFDRDPLGGARTPNARCEGRDDGEGGDH
eukprot:5757543-Prymnesium_polylepis.2